MTSQPNDPQLRLSSADLPTLAAAWEEAARAFLAVAETVNDAQWDLPTPCPEWTVGDIVTHIAAVESELCELPQPQPPAELPPHVGANPMSQWTERGVASRRGRSRQEVLVELAEVIELRSAQLQEGDLSEGTVTVGPGGTQRPLDVTLRMRLFDVWVHEQDVRTAIGTPGGMDEVGAHATAHTIASALPFVLGKKVGAAPGSSVRIVVSGDVPFDRTVAVGADGKAAFAAVPVEGATATVAMEWPAFVALGCGRADADVTIDGDAELGAAFVKALCIAP